jgi:hypothetical protein
MFTELSDHHHDMLGNLLVALKGKPISIISHSSYLPNPHPQAGTLCPYRHGCLDVHFMQIESYQMGSLWLVSSSQHNVLKVSPCVSMYQYDFYCRIIFHCMGRTYYMHLLTNWWVAGYNHCGLVCLCYKQCIQGFVCSFIFTHFLSLW